MTKLLKAIKPACFFQILIAGLLASALTSCYKSPEQLGANILPENSRLKVFYSDTATVYAYTQTIDSVRSDESSKSLLGSLSDPVFGKTSAGFYTQFQLSSTTHDFGTNPVLDSLVLQLYYAGTYGDTLTTLKVHTYELLEDIYLDSVYYSNILLSTGSTDYSDLEFSPRPSDSIPVFPDTIKGILRINLSNRSDALGNKLLNAPEDAMKDIESFQQYFKGLYLITEPVNSDGVILYFDLPSHFSNLTVYYRNDDKDSLKYQYPITVTCARINRFEHNYFYAAPEFKQQVLEGDTTLGDERVYVQGLSGAKTVITIPFIRDFKNLGTIGINEAILELPGAPEDNFFDAPKKMALVQRLEDGVYDLLPDQIEGEEYFGGRYNSSGNKYEFRITRYIQSLLLDSTTVNKGFYLFTMGGSVNPNRFVFNGPRPSGDTLSGIRLKILYTDTD